MEEGPGLVFGFRPELLVCKSPLSDSIPDCQALPQTRNPFRSLLGWLLSRPGGNALVVSIQGYPPPLWVAMVSAVIRVSFSPRGLRKARPEAFTYNEVRFYSAVRGFRLESPPVSSRLNWGLTGIQLPNILAGDRNRYRSCRKRHPPAGPLQSLWPERSLLATL